MCLYLVIMTLDFLNYVDAPFQKLRHIASLKSETMSKLIYRIPGLCLLISNIPGSALRTHAESLCDVNKRSQSLAW